MKGEVVFDVNGEIVFETSDFYEYGLRNPHDLQNDIPDFSGPQEDMGIESNRTGGVWNWCDS